MSDHEAANRVESGIQCPECYGVRITTRRLPTADKVEGFSCDECGCQWSPRIGWHKP